MSVRSQPELCKESLVDAPPGISGLLALGKLVTAASPVSTRRQATRRPPDTPEAMAGVS